MDLHHLALLAGRHRLRPRQARRPPAHPGPAGHASGCRPRGHPVTAALTAALRACAAGFYPSEAGTGLLIGHGGFLSRPDFGAFIHAATSMYYRTPASAEIDWPAVS